MSKPVILVTGAHGQLGNEINVLADAYPAFSFLFTDIAELAIDDPQAVRKFFAAHQPAYCINCAAYTAVDKAESDKETAYKVNADGAGNLAAACREHNTRFVHVSTDYVFDGQSPVPYKEEDAPNPMNVYGASKLKGEQLTLQNAPGSIIIRTAWVYSEFGHNFVKTMLRLMKERNEISVVNDQIGAPTYAADLAKSILDIISNCEQQISNWQPGIYHYSNQGRISWFDFAIAIKELSGSGCEVKSIRTIQYPTPAKRPAFSLLDTYKIQQTYKCVIPGWKDALQRCLRRL